LTDAGAATTPLTGVEPIEGGQIIARIDGEVVLASDVLWQVNQLIAANRDRIPDDQMETVREMLLRQQVRGLIDTKLLYADFRRTIPAENLPTVEKSLEEPFEETEIPRLIEILKVRNRDELQKLMQQHGTTLRDVKRQFVEKTIAGEWLRQRTPKPKPISHEQMLEYYRSHAKEYAFPAQARYEELMVRFDQFPDAQAAWSALAEMGNEVWNHVLANPDLRGPAFGDVARQKSHGFTAADGGIHDWTTIGALRCEAINKALATLEVGQLSNGIASDQGFHIVRVLERRDAGKTPFTKAQAQIREELERAQRQSLVEAEVAELRQSARVWTLFDGDVDSERLAQMLESGQRR
jgi:hypothetical protein